MLDLHITVKEGNGNVQVSQKAKRENVRVKPSRKETSEKNVRGGCPTPL